MLTLGLRYSARRRRFGKVQAGDPPLILLLASLGLILAASLLDLELVRFGGISALEEMIELNAGIGFLSCSLNVLALGREWT